VRSLRLPGGGTIPRRRSILCACILCPPLRKGVNRPFHSEKIVRVRLTQVVLCRSRQGCGGVVIASLVLHTDNPAPRALWHLTQLPVNYQMCPSSSGRSSLRVHLARRCIAVVAWALASMLTWRWVTELKHSKIYTKKIQSSVFSYTHRGLCEAGCRVPLCTDREITLRAITQDGCGVNFPTQGVKNGAALEVSRTGPL
jgi:hypothetical protein